MIGIGLCDVESISRLLKKHGEKFLRTCFSEEEIHYAFSTAKPQMHLAGRWAAKKALSAAVRCRSLPESWSSVTVAQENDGRPVFKFSSVGDGKFSRELSPGLKVSLSHTGSHAIAIVVAGGLQ